MSNPKPRTSTGRKRYRVAVGMNYRNKRREPGDIVADLPEKSLDWLEKQGYIIAIADELEGKEPEPAAEQVEPEVIE